MARKLKSDKVLFLATLLLVCASVVMVYSASAVVAMERYQQPYLFLTKQLMWATLGMAVLWIVMRVDYQMYREPVFIWSALAVVSLGLIAVMFFPPVNNARRWFGVEGVTKPKLPNLERWFAQISDRPGFIQFIAPPMT